jgi:hypothetical protein
VEHCVTEVDDAPEVVFKMAGTTGNLYKVAIGKVPSCDCPDGGKGNQCKHIFYGMSTHFFQHYDLIRSCVISLFYPYNH